MDNSWYISIFEVLDFQDIKDFGILSSRGVIPYQIIRESPDRFAGVPVFVGHPETRGRALETIETSYSPDLCGSAPIGRIERAWPFDNGRILRAVFRVDDPIWNFIFSGADKRRTLNQFSFSPDMFCGLSDLRGYQCINQIKEVYSVDLIGEPGPAFGGRFLGAPFSQRQIETIRQNLTSTLRR